MSYAFVEFAHDFVTVFVACVAAAVGGPSRVGGAALYTVRRLITVNITYSGMPPPALCKRLTDHDYQNGEAQ